MMLTQLEEARAPWNWDMDREEEEFVYIILNTEDNETKEVSESEYNNTPSIDDVPRDYCGWVKENIISSAL